MLHPESGILYPASGIRYRYPVSAKQTANGLWITTTNCILGAVVPECKLINYLTCSPLQNRLVGKK